jgi:hypothetical protein
VVLFDYCVQLSLFFFSLFCGTLLQHIFVSCSFFLYLKIFVTIFSDIGPKRDEVTGGWRKLHNEELRDFYSSPSIIRIIK